MAGFEVRLQRPAEAFLRGLRSDALDRVGLLLDDLEQNPHVDGVKKIPQVLPPVTLALYIDPEFWILYHIIHGDIVSVLNIDYAEEPVTPWRKD